MDVLYTPKAPPGIIVLSSTDNQDYWGSLGLILGISATADNAPVLQAHCALREFALNSLETSPFELDTSE